MSAILHVCTGCFAEERRGFMFTGTIPLGEEPRCAHCGQTMLRIVRLDGAEMSAAAEVAYDGTEIVVREPRWEVLRHNVLRAFTRLRGLSPRRRRDGLMELSVRDTLTLILQAVVDHISGQEGCLIACCIFDVGTRELATVRTMLGEMNGALGESSLVLGTLRDLFPLAEPVPTVIYRRFVAQDELHPERLAHLIEWASQVSLFVHEALSTFGFSPASLRFLRNLGMQDKAPSGALGARAMPDAAERHGFGVLELDELLSAADVARGRIIDREHVRRHILDFLRALEIDLAGASEGSPTQLAFHYRGVNLVLDFLSDPRDSYVRVQAQVASSLELDADSERVLATLTRGLLMGEVCLVPDSAGPDGTSRYQVVLQDTILGNDLNVDELARILANIAHQAHTFRASLAAGAIVEEAARGAALDGLLEFISHRAMQQSRTPHLSRLTQRVCEFLAQLELYPRLTAAGDLRLRYHDIAVTIHLGEVVPDSYVTIRASVAEWLGVARHEAVRVIAGLEHKPFLGGFRLQDSGEITFEDTILGNSLDLNEFAKTLHEVVTVATGSRPTLHALLADSSAPPAEHSLGGIAGAIEGLTTLYRRSSDESERRRAVRALAMFDDPAARACLFEALRDPSPEVSDLATAGLVADADGRSTELLDSIADLALDVALSDGSRRRAIRVLGAARRDAERVVGVLKQIALAEGETSLLRAFAFRAIGALGSPDAATTLVEGVKQPSYAVSHAALEAMATLGLPDPARLYVAAEEALERVRNRDDHDRATIFHTLARLGLHDTVLEIIEDDWQRSAEVAYGLAEACASHRPPNTEILSRMLAHKRGETRRVVYRAVAEHGLSDMADALAEALANEKDESLQPLAIDAIRRASRLTRKVADALQTASRDARLRRRALDTLHALRATQLQAPPQ